MTKMGRPKGQVAPATLTIRLQILITPQLSQWLAEQAATNKQSVGAYVREVLEQQQRDA